MGSPKALLKVNGITLLEDQVSRLKASGVDQVFVVTGAHTKEIRSNHKNLEKTWVYNDNWEKGKFSSLLRGLQAIPKKSSVLILPVDVAGVEEECIRMIIKQGLKTSKPIIPTYKKRGGHPVFLTESFIENLLKTAIESDRLDYKLKETFNKEYLEVSSKNILNNINTKEDWNAYIS